MANRASRFIDKQIRLTEYLHYMTVKDEKKRDEYKNKVKSLCSELDNIKKEFYMVKEDFKFSDDEEKMKDEISEFQKLALPVCNKHKQITQELYTVMDEINSFVDTCLWNEEKDDCYILSNCTYSGVYNDSDQIIIDSQFEIQKNLWKVAKMQYEDPDLIKIQKEMFK